MTTTDATPKTRPAAGSSYLWEAISDLLTAAGRCLLAVWCWLS